MTRSARQGEAVAVAASRSAGLRARRVAAACAATAAAVLAVMVAGAARGQDAADDTAGATGATGATGAPEAAEAAATAAAVVACEGEAALACPLPEGTYHLLLPDTDVDIDTEAGTAVAAPVLVLVHNAGGDAAAIAAEPILRTATARGYAVLVPQGIDQALTDDLVVPGWRLAGTALGGRDDISFIAHALSDAAQRFGLDAGSAVLTGFGHGASLAWEIACEAPWTAAAYAPRNGGYHGALPERCAAPVPVLHLHAPVRDGWPLNEAAEAEGRATRIDVQAHLSLAAKSFGCAAPAPLQSGLPATWDAVEFADCAPGASLALVLHDQYARTTATQIELILDWFETVERQDGTDGGATPLAASVAPTTATDSAAGSGPAPEDAGEAMPADAAGGGEDGA
ncbi:MAG: hypothetical protein AAF677_05840 [Pseudomonadota bacterium]